MKYIVTATWECESIVDANQQVKNLFDYDEDQLPESVSIYVQKEED